MRFDRATITLEPRTTSNCLDLAFVFVRRYFDTVAGLWLTIAAPACLVTFILVDRYEHTLLTALTVFAFSSSWLGITLTVGAAPCAFGEPFTFAGTMRRLGPATWKLFVFGLLQRVFAAVGFCLLLVPGWYLLVRTGFFVEQTALKNISRHLHDRRADELLKGEMGDLSFRLLWIAVYGSLVWFALLLIFDAIAGRLLGLPIFIGRLKVDMHYLEDFPEAARYAASFMWNDSIVVTAMLAVALLVYPLARMAWFFCYIDVRVRRDCWDMELKFLQEAARLEGTE